MSSGLGDALRLFLHRRFYSLKQIKQVQERALRRLIDHSVKYSPYYREILKDLSIHTIEDLDLLPVINKEIMMTHFDRLNTVGLVREEVQAFAVKNELDRNYLGYYLDKYVIGLSSGTSGNKGLYVTPRELTKKLPYVFLARGGIPLRNLPFKILFCLRVFSQGFDDINSPLVSLSYCATMTPVEEIISQLNTKHINILMAPPSLIRLLLPIRDEIKVKLKQIVCYAEVLEKEEKERFKKQFDTDIVEIYQASEGQIASACSHGNLHINEDLVIVELSDENGHKVDQPGIVARHMIVTNLVNFVQPLIRYEMNDLIVLGEPCSCGSKFRTIDRILGRNDDILRFKITDGKIQTVFPDLFSRWIITSSDAIREYQVLQNDMESVEVHLELLSETENVDGIVALLKERILHELAVWDIHPQLQVFVLKIELPADRSKYKRFIVKQPAQN